VSSLKEFKHLKLAFKTPAQVKTRYDKKLWSLLERDTDSYTMAPLPRFPEENLGSHPSFRGCLIFVCVYFFLLGRTGDVVFVSEI
jgi:hypothetical protein